MLGTARSKTELDELLASALSGAWEPSAGPDIRVFSHLDGLAAARIANAVLQQARDGSVSRNVIAQPGEHDIGPTASPELQACTGEPSKKYRLQNSPNASCQQ
jgi:hypothetical protein